MSIITLISDWLKHDYYDASIKAALLSRNPDLKIVDIQHQIDTFDQIQASFVLKSVLSKFPIGTVHFIAIQSVNNTNSNVFLGISNGQYILSSQITFLSILQIKFEKIIEIECRMGTFPELDVFVPIALKLVDGLIPETLGKIIDQLPVVSTLKPAFEPDKITAPIQYFDSYGNAIIEVSFEEFEHARQNRKFEIFINSLRHKTQAIHQNYNSVPENEIFSLFNSLGFLEIGIRMRSIERVLNLNKEASIIIKFYS